MSQTKSASAAVATVSVLVLLTLIGCTANQAPNATESPAPAVSATDPSWPVVEFGGTGERSESVAVPKGANSLVIEFACTGGTFVISIGPDWAGDRMGNCGGLRSYTLPVLHTDNLVVTATVFDEDAAFVLHASFIREKTVPDAGITSDCEKLSAIESSLVNAREGLGVGDIDADGWVVALEEASTDLTALRETSEGLIGQQLPALADALSGNHPLPESLFESKPFQAAQEIVSQVCAHNGTPIVIMAQYGG